MTDQRTFTYVCQEDPTADTKQLAIDLVRSMGGTVTAWTVEQAADRTWSIIVKYTGGPS